MNHLGTAAEGTINAEVPGSDGPPAGHGDDDDDDEDDGGGGDKGNEYDDDVVVMVVMVLSIVGMVRVVIISMVMITVW